LEENIYKTYVITPKNIEDVIEWYNNIIDKMISEENAYFVTSKNIIDQLKTNYGFIASIYNIEEIVKGTLLLRCPHVLRLPLTFPFQSKWAIFFNLLNGNKILKSDNDMVIEIIAMLNGFGFFGVHMSEETHSKTIQLSKRRKKVEIWQEKVYNLYFSSLIDMVLFKEVSVWS